MLRKFITGLVFGLVSLSVWAAPVDINSATADVIAKELDGIGPNKAAAIVKYREANGPFKNMQELLKVKGIGQKTLEQNRENIKLASE